MRLHMHPTCARCGGCLLGPGGCSRRACKCAFPVVGSARGDLVIVTIGVLAALGICAMQAWGWAS